MTSFPYINAAIASVHSVFNITNTFIFVWFIKPFAAFLEKIVPNKPYIDKPHLTRLDVLMVETPIIGIEQSRRELIVMSDRDRTMLTDLKNIISKNATDQALIKPVFDGEETLDTMQKEITVFLTELLSERILSRLSDEAQDQIRIADEYESIGDYITTILKLHLRISKASQSLPETMLNDLFELHGLVFDFFDVVRDAFIKNDIYSIKAIKGKKNSRITGRFRELRSSHLKRISETRLDPMICTAYMDILTDYRKIKDHLLNIAEVVAGEK